MFSPFDVGFPFAMPFLLFVGFVLLFIVVPALVKQARISASPLERRQARLVSKRTEVWGRQRTRTNYYLTFEFDGGHRAEFEATGEQFGLVVEGDAGELVSQGPVIRSFERGL